MVIGFILCKVGSLDVVFFGSFFLFDDKDLMLLRIYCVFSIVLGVRIYIWVFLLWCLYSFVGEMEK